MAVYVSMSDIMPAKIVYRLGFEESSRTDRLDYENITDARRVGFAKAYESNKRVNIFKGYKRLTIEGTIIPLNRSKDAWGGKVFYEYFSDSKRKWVIRRLTSDGKLHEEYENVKW